MDVLRHVDQASSHFAQLRASGLSIGFVPTMGALHRGHEALIKASKAENDLTVCSIYVNPAQFNDANDLANYPRTEGDDLMLLEKEGCDAVFIPQSEGMYPSGFHAIQFDFGSLGNTLEGRFRPGHFSGVALIVSKLFHIVGPNVAYFGQKDYQQFRVVSCLCDALNFPLTLRSVPTVREADGLAISSRNRRLTPVARDKATIFFKSLTAAKLQLESGQSMPHIKKETQDRIDGLPGMRLEYFELVDRQSLAVIDQLLPKQEAVLLIAGYADEVRLIDNMLC